MNHPTRKVLPERIKNRRMAADLTQDQLGDLIGKSRQAVGMYENGEREPDLETLQLIAYATNTSMSYLLGETDDPSPPPRVAAAHQKEPPGTPLKPHVQVIIEKAIRNAIQELDEYERRQREKEAIDETEGS